MSKKLELLIRLVGAVCVLALVIAPLRVEAAQPDGLDLTYDSANRLVRSDDGETLVTYHYDGRGQLVRSCTFVASGPSDCSELIIDERADHHRLVGEIRTNGEGTRHILYAHGPDGVAVVADDGALRYPLRDHQGSVRGLADGTGAVVGRVAYDAYGRVRARVGEQVRLGYTGEWTSSHDLVYLRARHYAPQIGRFLQRDEHAGTPGDPRSLNRYTYAHNNPLANTDPSGRAIPVMFWIIGISLLGLGLGVFAAGDHYGGWTEGAVVAATELTSNTVNLAAKGLQSKVSGRLVVRSWERGIGTIIAGLDWLVHGNSGTGAAVMTYADAPRTWRNHEMPMASVYLSEQQTWNALRNSRIGYTSQTVDNGRVKLRVSAFNVTFGNYTIDIEGHCTNGVCQGWLSIYDDFDFDVVHHKPSGAKLHRSNLSLTARAARNLGTMGAQLLLGLGKKSEVEVKSAQTRFVWMTKHNIDTQIVEAARSRGQPNPLVGTGINLWKAKRKIFGP
ncbi:MAG: RHS repeat-associated core domain-containing protein [Myxococcota bacterium]